MCSHVVMAMVGWVGQGKRWWIVCMRDKAGRFVACREMPEHFPSAR